MSYVAAIALLIIVIYRPQEFIPQLEGLPFLHVICAFGFLATIYEFASGQQKDSKTPQGPIVIMFLIWCFISTFINMKAAAPNVVYIQVGIPALFFLIIAYGTRNASRFKGVIAVTAGIALSLSAIAIKQGRSPMECIELDDDDEQRTGPPKRVPDIQCESRRECWDQNEVFEIEPNFICERLGLANTYSVNGRVRWRGKLEDPNELSMFCSACLAFAFAFYGIAKSWWRHVWMALACAVTLYCVILSQSRGGTLVIGVVFFAAFVRRFGLKGAVLGIMAAAPGVLLGGRSGDEAEGSAEERTELLREGFEMITHHPFGVGVQQYADNTSIGLTAHNSYLLTAAELGLPGMFMWASLLYISVKIPAVLSFRPPPALDPNTRALANGLFVGYLGMMTGITFLSFAYHPVLWTFFGFSGGLYGVVRSVDPTFEIKISPKEIGIVCAACVSFLVLLYVSVRLKGG